MRESPEYEFDKPLLDVGNRQAHVKTYALLNHRMSSGTRSETITVIDYSNALLPKESGPKFLKFILSKIEVHNNQIIIQFFLLILIFYFLFFYFVIFQLEKHPFVLSPVKADVLPMPHNKVIIIRKYSLKGSLRDIIHKVFLYSPIYLFLSLNEISIAKKASPQNAYSRKYSADSGKPLPIKEVAYYAKQILTLIQYFNAINYSLPHLHSSNLLISHDKKNIL